MSVIQFESIELLLFLKKRNYLWSTEFFKVSIALDNKHLTYGLRDMEDDELQKVKNNGMYQTKTC